MAYTPTPEKLAEYSKLHDAAVEKVLSIMDAPDWTLEKEDKDIVFYKRFEPSSSFTQIKSVVTIPDSSLAEVQKALEPILSIDEKTPDNQRHGLDISREVAGNTSDYNIFYIATTSPGPMISGRDFIFYRKKVEKDGKLIYINVSVPDDDIVPPNSKYVRGVMSFQGYVAQLEPDGKTVKLQFFVHADPKGKVPSWAYNKVVTSQGYAAKGIRSRILKSRQ